ncbi:DUF5961 family protein [Phenylobacterium sp.]|uniref:DUF5961 family protein n=1 Tax=Phenylobacterium sp. TaxID=1871053 RepID=UPI002732C04E|nr:DUF5961 family protein [Phenylobacterium sp.]MDP3660685.1 DUF5961 family protein [Phenylobacterium sp.]
MTPTPAASPLRSFSVHATEGAPGRAHMVEGASFEDAAVHFAMEWGVDADGDGEASVMVEDQDSGERHCFRIDLGSGDAAPCD